MAVSLCSGTILWHRDHDAPIIKVYRLVDNPDGTISRQYLAEIQPGCSATVDDDGVKITVENPCPTVP